ncbi:DUF4435 domain-containing protein [Ectothiorhodospiraceae bacterium BW-2]|nr:DUF4435 domain-containing protein [Ectothiorhodospiraceae bacterium BW-2]
MSKGISTTIKKIKEQQIGATRKGVLIVEGVDDAAFYAELLSKRHAGWESSFCIVEVGGKKIVLDILIREPDWFGIVDRDEWSSEVLTEKQTTHPNLWISPRFCVENYLIVPQELWAAFPEKQRKILEGEHKLREALLNDLDRWVAHGVLWSVINPLWEGLRSRGFKEDLLSPEVALDSDRIKEKLKEWHQFLDPECIMVRYESTLERVRALPQDERLKQWIHGKSFYSSVVNPALNTLLGQKSEKDRRSSIIRTLPLPDDLSALWDRLGSAGLIE